MQNSLWIIVGQSSVLKMAAAGDWLHKTKDELPLGSVSSKIYSSPDEVANTKTLNP